VGLNAPIEMGPWVLWTAFAIAFTPALVTAARFVAAGDAPIDRAPLVGAALLAWSVASVRSAQQPPRRDGAALLLAACLLELVGISGRSWSIAHLALPLGVVGLARLLGSPRLPVAALAFFAIPPPYFATALLSPRLEAGYAAAGSVVANALGLPVRASLSTLDGPGGGVDLIAADGGVALAHLLAGIGWFGGVRRNAPLAPSAAVAVAWGLAAFPLQAAGVVLAAVATGAGEPALGRFLLRHALWLLAALAGILLVVRRPAPVPSRGGADL
jgi:hypothetical protein